jgi:co-chaperonin GroES (HSP10)
MARVKRTVSGASSSSRSASPRSLATSKGDSAVAIWPGPRRCGDLDAFVFAVGAGDAHQKGRKREARVVEGQRFGFGGRQAAQEITNHGQPI